MMLSLVDVAVGYPHYVGVCGTTESLAQDTQCVTQLSFQRRQGILHGPNRL